MKPLLAIMNPRNITAAVESIEALPVDRCWMRGYTEVEIECEAWPVLMRDAKKARYSHVVVMSDDGRVPIGSWHDIIRIAQRGHPVVTGYCNLDMNRGFEMTNMVAGVLPQETADAVNMEFYSLPEMLSYPDDEVPTSFHGYSLTCMTMEIAEAFPFQCYHTDTGGFSSDFHQCRRLADEGVDIMAARDGFVLHLKEYWNSKDEGKRHQAVHLDAKTRTLIWDKK